MLGCLGFPNDRSFSQKKQTRSMVAAKSAVKIKPQSGVNVEDISTEINIQGYIVPVTVNYFGQHQDQSQLPQHPHVSVSQSSGPLPPHSTDMAAPPGGVTGRLPGDPTVQCVETEVAAECKGFKRMLQLMYQQQFHAFARKETENFRKRCSEVVTEGMICADKGVECALHLDDLYCTIKAGGSAADIEWHLTELRQEAVEGKRCASELQTRFHEIKALGVVTGWLQELIGGLDQIDQWAKKDANRTMKLIDDQKYLGLRFRAYVSQVSTNVYFTKLGSVWKLGNVESGSFESSDF
ncbi:hypothetical protein C8J56DRAFT_1022366 [Mycena floridula]|nr:hypothetical protein C8J56DRAFT_1022366 [Mycena floridula]